MAIKSDDCKQAIVDHLQKTGCDEIVQAHSRDKDWGELVPGEFISPRDYGKTVRINTKEELVDLCTKKICWKRMKRQKTDVMIMDPYYDSLGRNAPSDGYIERAFDCTPFDDQIRAYVYTDANDTQILRVVVQGE